MSRVMQQMQIFHTFLSNHELNSDFMEIIRFLPTVVCIVQLSSYVNNTICIIIDIRSNNTDTLPYHNHNIIKQITQTAKVIQEQTMRIRVWNLKNFPRLKVARSFQIQ
jgi:hypothetical protein